MKGGKIHGRRELGKNESENAQEKVGELIAFLVFLTFLL